MNNTILLSDFLTAEEEDRILQAFNGGMAEGKFVDFVENEIAKPNIARINETLGQKNEPRYLAYAVLFACLKARKEKRGG